MDPYHSPTANYPISSTSDAPPVRSQSVGCKNAQWNDYETKVFIVACESVIADGHRIGKCFSKHGWETLVRLFNTNSGHNWTKQQLKNRWNALRTKHKRLEELINSSGIGYDPSTGRISAPKEWWVRKIKENKDYKEFKDKDCRDVYGYKVLFCDAFDCDKYVVTPTKACRTGFAMFKDSGYEDDRDTISVDVESSGSSDEGEKVDAAVAPMDVSRVHSGDKRKSSTRKSKGKKKISAQELSYSVECGRTTSERVAAKIDNLIGPPVSDQKTCMQELLGTGQMQKNTDLYFWTCTFLSQKRNREMLDTQEDANEKFALVEWNWQEYCKVQPW